MQQHNLYYINPTTLAIIPTINNAIIITIGDTFFFNNQQHNNVNNTAANPGINESKFCCKVVTFSIFKPLAPKELYCVKASLIPSAPEDKFYQSI